MALPPPTGAAATPPMPAPPATGGPSASPMMTPQKAAGNQASGKAKVMIAQHILATALLDLGVSSTEGGAVLDALKTLTKKFGKTEEDSKQIMPAELQMALMRSAGPGAPPGAPAGGGAPPPPQAAAA